MLISTLFLGCKMEYKWGGIVTFGTSVFIDKKP
jgi:hypothetical protein